MRDGLIHARTHDLMDRMRRIALMPVPLWRDVPAGVGKPRQVDDRLAAERLTLRLLLALVTAFYVATVVWAAATYYALGY